MSKYKGQEILDLSDQELNDVQFELQWLLGHRENRLYQLPERLKEKSGKPKFDFQTINPAFINIQKEVTEELKLRKARS